MLRELDVVIGNDSWSRFSRLFGLTPLNEMSPLRFCCMPATSASPEKSATVPQAHNVPEAGFRENDVVRASRDALREGRTSDIH